MQQTNDPMRDLREATAYLQKTTRQIVTLQALLQKQFETQSLERRQQVQELTRSAQAVTGSAHRLIGEAVAGIRDQAREAVAPATSGLLSAAEAFERQKALLDQARKRYALTWIGGIVLAAVLAMAGVGAYVASKKRELDELMAQIGTLSAYNAADVTSEGERLWVNVDLKNKRSGVNSRTYYLVKPRQGAGAGD
jgi:hypothetical protein